jgi:Zn-dependent protease with chaperone function
MAESAETPFARRLDTPAREKLLADFGQTESFCRAIIGVEIIGIVAALAWVFFATPRPGLWAWIALALGGLGVFRWFIHHVFLSKKRIEDIRPDAQFGVHNRDSLVRLAETVFQTLGLKRDAAPVFLTRAKDVNAQAIRCELWPGQHLFNGVFLNRSIIHLLDEPELASVIGHELGHVFPYGPLLSRCYALHALFAGTVSFALTATFQFPAVAFVAPFVVLLVLDRVIALPHMRLSRGIEFLCDDYGARAAGLLPTLSAEYKIAVEHEARMDLLLRLLEMRQKGLKCSARDLADAYDEAIPFGKADVESFERELQRFSEQRKKQSRRLSLGGFLEHLQGADADDDNAETRAALEAQLNELRALRELPLIDLDRTQYVQGSGAWTFELAGNLMRALESQSDRVLIRTAEELDDRGSTHPNASRRMLFLWRSRGAQTS